MWRWKGKERTALRSYPTDEATLLAFRPHRVDVLGARKGAVANVGCIAGDRGFDRMSELSVAPHEFRHPRGESAHVLKHQDLAVAGNAAADADRGDRNGSADAPGKRLGNGLDDDREGSPIGNRAGIVLDRPPMRLLASLCAKRADGVDGLRGEPDMAHHRHAALHQKSDGLRHATAALELDGTAARFFHDPRRRHEGLLPGC